MDIPLESISVENTPDLVTKGSLVWSSMWVRVGIGSSNDLSGNSRSTEYNRFYKWNSDINSGEGLKRFLGRMKSP